MNPFRFNKPEFFLRSSDAEGSGGDTPPADPNGAKTGDEGPKDAPDVQAMIAKAVADAVAGLKKKNEEVIGTNKKLKDDLAAAKAQPTLSEDEYTEFRSLKERIERDEMLRMLTEGKSEELIERVTKKARLDADAKLAAEAEARATSAREAGEWKSRYEQTLVNIEITKSAAASVKPQYQDLVTKLVAERVKLVDGEVRVVDASGAVQMSPNGSKPLTVGDYVEGLRATYSDLFVASSGGGANGSGKRPPGGTGNKLSAEAAENLSMEEYTRLRSEGKI
jgi:hypothetical protein